MNATRTAHTGKSEAGANTTVDEQRIRELAYQIWETEGCPDGQRDRHWDMARKLAEIETREEPKPAARARRINKPAAAPEPIILPPPQAQTKPRSNRNKLDA